ncbi:hypothetical protein VTN31DRAFT_377 [Thermomyces dupontii]|uniref:uncharacterized protein n=1 Tax=Talaromyces thermophilus TaxID=28565 RepID=UPI003743BBE8
MSLFKSRSVIFTAAGLLRLVLLFYGLYQDNHSAVKYTDIDYMVFTDASRFVFQHESPYARDTYRYTPLLAWLLLPTTWQPAWLWFSFGKVLFAVADLVAGWLLVQVLQAEYGSEMPDERALRFASIWLLNPMVATISTRGSSEGLLGVIVIATMWALLKRRIGLAGFLLGFGVHFKIYPFIYAVSMAWWLDDGSTNYQGPWALAQMRNLITPARIKLAAWALTTFIGLNLLMYVLYGPPFLQHTFLHHLTRIDHRHNFSPYNTLLYLSAAAADSSGPRQVRLESLAFVPQLFLAAVGIPLVLAKKSLPGAMLAQTFAFVTFNKVCTSQYFLWYLVLLPLYLPSSSFLKRPALGILALLLWVAAQAAWLQQGYQLEFLGHSTFVPGLWLASLAFFTVNIWILGVIVSDVGISNRSGSIPPIPPAKKHA